MFFYIINIKNKKYYSIFSDKYKKKFKWKKENIRLHYLFKEYLYGFYENIAFNLYSKYLGHYFYFPNKYEFMLTNSMKIKCFLWTSPIIVQKNEDPIIELRTIETRINDILKYKMNFQKWKSLKYPKKISKFFYKI